MTATHTAVIDSPVGRLGLAATDEALTLIEFGRQDEPRPPEDPILRETQRQLAEYFAGERTTFDLPLAPQGTPFQRQVWAALQEIPYGETWTYGRLARHIGLPTAFRAVGAANGQNPIPIVIPCHRVVGTNGKLTGYGGGLPRKRLLLELEATTRLTRDLTPG